jgi:hypothetical protein
MNLLQNKRKRDEISFESNTLKDINNINSFYSKNYLNCLNSNEKIIIDENKNNNNLYNIFETIFNNKNKIEKIENNLLSPFFNPNLCNQNADKIFQNSRLKLFFLLLHFNLKNLLI